MIVPVSVQLKGEREPHERFALVFEDITVPEDFISYRNAATMAAKTILCSNFSQDLTDECYWLLQFAEYISTSLDSFLSDSFASLLADKKLGDED